MCFGGGGDNGAQQAAMDDAKMQAKEMERQARIRAGQGAVDENFKQFDDGYYKDFQNSHDAYYKPQVDRQYGEAKDQTTAALAGRGMLESTAGAGGLAKLFQRYGDTNTDIANQGVDAVNALKGNVEKAKTNLYGLATASADPSGVAARAQGEAGTIAAPQSHSPLGQVFSDLITPATYAYTAGNNSLRRPGGGLFGAPSGAGSSTTVRS